jgi:hypothetical protein
LNRISFFVFVSDFDGFPQVSRDKGKHAALICENCLRRVNEANKTIEDIQNSDKEYFEKLRGDENGSMAGQEANGIVEVKIEVDVYRFSDGQTVREIKEEPVEVKQEERPPVRSLAHVRETESDKASEGQCESAGKKNEQEGDEQMQSSDENQATKEVESSEQQRERQNRQPKGAKLKKGKRRAEVRKNAMKQIESKKNQKSDQKVFQCQICSKKFDKNSKLRRHFEAVHQKKVNISCDLCPRQFYEKSSLKRHMASHIFCNDDTFNSDRPFKCNFKDCKKFFKTRTSLGNHQKRHSGNSHFVHE